MSAVKGASCFALHHMNMDILTLKYTLHYSKLAKMKFSVIFPNRYRGLHHPFSQGTKNSKNYAAKEGYSLLVFYLSEFVWTIAEQSLSFGSLSERD